MTTRCAWVTQDPLYIKYHDEEWGVPTHDDRKHFEFIVLESAQAGLSWLTILRRRENYRKAFADFDPKAVSAFDAKKEAELLANDGIIRNRLKVAAAIQNARVFCELQAKHGSFDSFARSFLGGSRVNTYQSIKEIPPFSKEAEALAKELKKRGFRFFGPTICYAHMQAVGLVNDHTTDCFRYDKVTEIPR